MAKTSIKKANNGVWWVQMYLSFQFLFPMCFTPHQFIYDGSQNTKMVWLKELLCYGKRRYFNLVSGAQSVEIELPEVVEGRCGV
jgi:hypothetical protein